MELVTLMTINNEHQAYFEYNQTPGMLSFIDDI